MNKLYFLFNNADMSLLKYNGYVNDEGGIAVKFYVL
jgi:hypothetical protein